MLKKMIVFVLLAAVAAGTAVLTGCEQNEAAVHTHKETTRTYQDTVVE
jgi:archaellin